MNENEKDPLSYVEGSDAARAVLIKWLGELIAEPEHDRGFRVVLMRRRPYRTMAIGSFHSDLDGDPADLAADVIAKAEEYARCHSGPVKFVAQVAMDGRRPFEKTFTLAANEPQEFAEDDAFEDLEAGPLESAPLKMAGEEPIAHKLADLLILREKNERLREKNRASEDKRRESTRSAIIEVLRTTLPALMASLTQTSIGSSPGPTEEEFALLDRLIGTFKEEQISALVEILDGEQTSLISKIAEARERRYAKRADAAAATPS